MGDNPYLQRRERTELDLRIVPPPGVEDVDDFVDRVEREHRRLEALARAGRKAKAHSVKGATAVRLEKWFRKPKRGATLFQLNPRVAARVGARVSRIVALASLKKFRIEYAEAMRLFRARKRHVVFPHGTWKMRVMFDVRGAAPPGAAA